MGKTKTTKAVSLLISIIVCCLALQDIQDWSEVGIFKDCGPGCRMSYPFYHVNIIHAALNAWCLLSVVFSYTMCHYGAWYSHTFPPYLFQYSAYPIFQRSDFQDLYLSCSVLFLSR